MAAPIKRIAIFASGEGTNFTALCHAFAQQNLPLKVCLLVCDHENANVLERAAHENVPTLVVNFKDHPDKANIRALPWKTSRWMENNGRCLFQAQHKIWYSEKRLLSAI